MKNSLDEFEKMNDQLNDSVKNLSKSIGIRRVDFEKELEESLENIRKTKEIGAINMLHIHQLFESL